MDFEGEAPDSQLVLAEYLDRISRIYLYSDEVLRGIAFFDDKGNRLARIGHFLGNLKKREIKLAPDELIIGIKSR